jgi:hypothetical protein
VGSDDNRGRTRRLGAEDGGWSSTDWVLSGQTIEMSGDAMCGLHCAHGNEEREFFG